MDLKTIKNLLNLIEESDVNEVSIEEGDFKIKVKKKPDVVKTEAPPAYMPSPVGIQASLPQPELAQQTAKAPGSNPPPAEKEEPASSNTITLNSPIVGTFYAASSPGSDPFIKVGDVIKKGDTLCIVEAMKIMNEIEAESGGKIVKILAEDAQPVEFDQPLFLIEPA